MCGGSEALIRIAPSGRPAKSGRPQPASMPRGPGLHALRALVRCCGDEELLAGVSASRYYRQFVSCVMSSGLQCLGLTPHSPRAGGATEARHRGAEEPELTRRGRWAARRSMLTYLDQVGAIAGSTRIPPAAKTSMEYNILHLYDVFPELRWGLERGESVPNFEVMRSHLLEATARPRPQHVVGSRASPGFMFMNIDDAAGKSVIRAME